MEVHSRFGQTGPMPRIIPEPRHFSIPSIVVAGAALRSEALNWTPWVRSLSQDPARLHGLPCRDRRAVAENRDQVALPAGFDTHDAEAVLVVVKGDPLDQAGQDLGWRARPGWLHHYCRMNREGCTHYLDRGPSPLLVGGAST
jgi:hypothetical protein